jgi:hypothetical protein
MLENARAKREEDSLGGAISVRYIISFLRVLCCDEDIICIVGMLRIEAKAGHKEMNTKRYVRTEKKSRR